MKIHFFHTNDVHSHFEEFLQVSTELRKRRHERQQQGETVFTFDIGDHADRKRMETEGTFGRTNAALIREVGYDAWTFGNNEGLTLRKDKWADLVNESETPCLIANLFDMQTREPYACFEPYLIFERDGLRVAVIGITVPFFDFYKMHGVYAEHPRETFARILPEIRRQEADLVVLMSHLGLSSDRQIAEEIEGIDIIFGGHTHNVLVEPELVNGTIICQAGFFGRYFGQLTVEWDEASRKIVGYSGGAVERDAELTPDADLVAEMERWQSHAAEQLDEAVAELSFDLGHALAGNSPLANVLTDGMRELTGASVAMINAGMFNHGLVSGTVTRNDLLTCFSSPSITCVVELTGKQILSVLRKSLDPAFIQDVGKGYGFRGHFVGGLQVSGLTVYVTESEDISGEPTLDVEIDGQPLREADLYEVAVTDYLYFAPVLEEIKQGRNVRFELPFLRELLGDQLARRRAVENPEDRWVFREAEQG
ncbi:MAG TPA: bifunctional UDP-sugar hydrolase/5'-nucleotidase [Bacilli bacterium]|nr:bifunctional UDP-sugar hydrolase/5'-nucleotidase [Bacilli bacterium]